MRKELFKKGRPCSDKGLDARTIHRILDSQSPEKMTICEGSSTTLPGGVPLIDHLYVNMGSNPDWRMYIPAVEDLRKHRLPDQNHLSSVWEITLGITDPVTIDTTIEFIKAKIKETTKKYGFCSLAVDTESVAVHKGCMDMLLSKPYGESHELKIASVGMPADNIPVLLMIGHVGWQVHIRLPTDKIHQVDDDSLLAITPGQLQPNLVRLLKECKNLTGVGVTKDLRQFFEVVKALYGSDLLKKIPPSTELETLARFAGYNCPRYSMATLNWIAMGTLMPKGRCSMGDGNWHFPWANLPKPLQAYLIGDIAQAAAISWILTMCWVIHIFPDMHLVRQVSVFNQLSLLRWWQSQVISHLPDALPGQWTPVSSRKDMVELLTTSSNHSNFLRSMHPDWPSITSGGARFLHTVRSFFVARLPLLRSTDDQVWFTLREQQLCNIRFGRDNISADQSPTNPTMRLGLVSNPDIMNRLKGHATELTPDYVRVVASSGIGTRALISEYARLYPFEGQKILETLERSRHASKKFFHFSRKGKEITPDLRLMMSVFDMMPPRPDGWIDPYPSDERQDKLVRETAHASAIAARLSKKAELLTRRSTSLINNITIAKRKAVQIVNQTCAKPSLQPSSYRNKEPAAKRPRSGVPATATSATQDDPTHTTFNQSSTNEHATMLQGFKSIFVVGNTHALHLGQAFRRLLQNTIQVQSLPMVSMHPSCFAQTAEALSRMDLENSAVIFWPFDHAVYFTEASKDGLSMTRSSVVPHCVGNLQVSAVDKVAVLCELALPLFEQAVQAAASVVVTPLPPFIAGPCCNLSHHSTHVTDSERCRLITRRTWERGVDFFHWILGSGYDIRLLSPFDELMKGKDNTQDVWRTLYSQDGMHLSNDAYSKLATLLASTLKTRPLLARPAQPGLQLPAQLSHQHQINSPETHRIVRLRSESPVLHLNRTRELAVAGDQFSGRQSPARLRAPSTASYNSTFPSNRSDWEFAAASDQSTGHQSPARLPVISGHVYRNPRFGRHLLDYPDIAPQEPATTPPPHSADDNSDSPFEIRRVRTVSQDCDLY